ncbi:hypothetical protein BYT27DRAFT_7197782, partial [Phlegmacium glaucopus]
MFTASWLRRRSTLYSINPRALLSGCAWVGEYVFCQHAFITDGDGTPDRDTRYRVESSSNS